MRVIFEYILICFFIKSKISEMVDFFSILRPPPHHPLFKQGVYIYIYIQQCIQQRWGIGRYIISSPYNRPLTSVLVVGILLPMIQGPFFFFVKILSFWFLFWDISKNDPFLEECQQWNLPDFLGDPWSRFQPLFDPSLAQCAMYWFSVMLWPCFQYFLMLN